MRAVGIKAFGNADVVEAMSIDPPEPRAGCVRVKVAFTSVNPIDVHVRRGDFLGSRESEPLWPLILGYEGAGIVDVLGPDVQGLKPGDRVAWSGIAGAQAELAVVPAWRLVPVPEAMPLDIACALQLDGMLAHALSVSVFPIQSGDWVLIEEAAAPMALILIQIAKAQGARVIATVARDDDRGAPRAAGADHVVAWSTTDVAAFVASATERRGCDVVFDGRGRESIDRTIASCRRRGMVVLHGGSSGAVEAIRPDVLAAAGSLFITRPHLGDFMQDAVEIRWRMDGLFQACLDGELKVGPSRILPLEAAREGHLAIEAGTASGKILLKI